MTKSWTFATITGMDDGLSDVVQRVLKLGGPNAYEKLVVDGDGNAQARQMLAAGGALAKREEQRCLIAGLYLWHDCLPEAHEIAQGIASATGSFWHAILHRREGDFSNSKYWYARCTTHPALKTLDAEASSLVSKMPADKSLLGLIRNGWDPSAFVDLVESVHADESNPKHALAIALQQLEWRTLFAHN